MEQLTDPIVGELLARSWSESPDKPTALGTPLRYSSALGCARQMGYYSIAAEKTNPQGPADSWAPGIGTILHEELQERIAEFLPGTLFEVASSANEYVSGSADGLISTDEVLRETGVALTGTHVVWELKTMGEYAFDRQVGYNRRYARVGQGEGPKVEAITQAGMNAVGIERQETGVIIDYLLLTSVTLAPVSVGKAHQMGLKNWERFGAEWLIPRHEWEPLALRELARMELIGGALANQELSDRTIGDGSYLNPRGSKDWQCDYCPFRDRCVDDGEGYVRL